MGISPVYWLAELSYNSTEKLKKILKGKDTTCLDNHYVDTPIEYFRLDSNWLRLDECGNKKIDGKYILFQKNADLLSSSLL